MSPPWDTAFGEDAFADDDESAPEVANIDPVPGSTLAANAPFQFDVTDDVGLDVLRVEVQQASWEVAYEEGAFTPAYKNASIVTPLEDGGGFHFILRRASGWSRNPIGVRVTASDTEGSLAT